MNESESMCVCVCVYINTYVNVHLLFCSNCFTFSMGKGEEEEVVEEELF